MIYSSYPIGKMCPTDRKDIRQLWRVCNKGRKIEAVFLTFGGYTMRVACGALY